MNSSINYHHKSTVVESSLPYLCTYFFFCFPQLLQVGIQTPMIMDGLRRCSDSARNQDSRPGRNIVAFLLVSNLAIYFWDTMEVKNIYYQSSR